MTGNKNFMKYDGDIREWINRIYSEVESMKKLLEENQYNITKSDIDLSQNLNTSEFLEKTCCYFLLEPVVDTSGNIRDYTIVEQSDDLSSLGFKSGRIIGSSAGLLAGKSALAFLQFIAKSDKNKLTRITDFLNVELSRFFQVTVIPREDKKVELLLLDQTSLQQHQLQVKRYENLYSKAEETSTTGFYQYNTKNQEIYITEGILSIFECAPTSSPTEKKSLDKYIHSVHDEDKEFVLEMISEDNLTSSVDFQHRIIVHDKVKYVHVRGSLFYDTLEDTISLIGTMEDITSFKMMEIKLNQTRKLLDEAEKIAHLSSWRYDFLHDSFNGSIEASNIIGVTPEDFPFSIKDFMNFFYKEDKIRFHNEFQKALAEHSDLTGKYKLIDRVGRIKHVFLICWNHYTEEGKPQFTRGYIQDITKSISLEEELNNKRNELETLKKEHRSLESDFDHKLQSRLNEIRQKDKYRLQNYQWNTIANILQQVARHWLQPVNLLSTQIQNFIEAYQYEELDAQAVERKYEELKDLLGEITAIIEIFRDRYDQNQKQEVFTVNGILKELHNVFSAKFSKFNIAFDIDEEEDCYVKGFKNNFTEAVYNLLQNSIDIFEKRQIDKPVLAILLRKKSGAVILKVSDNGGGIADEILDRIFEPYFSSNKQYNTSGLGLFVVRKIVEKDFQGKLEAFNLDNGACFRIKIPCSEK